MKLNPSYRKIDLGICPNTGQGIITFVCELRFIDINNLSKYTVKQLIDIFGGKIGNAKKADYIKHILLKCKDKIVADNREYKLNSLGI